MPHSTISFVLLCVIIFMAVCSQLVLHFNRIGHPQPEGYTPIDWSISKHPLVKLHRGSDGKLAYISNTVSDVTMLQTGGVGIEAELRSGRWLVLVVPSNSGSPNDRLLENSIFTIRRIVGEQVRVALRPVEGEADFCAWLPTRCQYLVDKMEVVSPLWLVFQDGVLVEESGGLMPPSEVKAFALGLASPKAPE